MYILKKPFTILIFLFLIVGLLSAQEPETAKPYRGKQIIRSCDLYEYVDGWGKTIKSYNDSCRVVLTNLGYIPSGKTVSLDKYRLGVKVEIYNTKKKLLDTIVIDDAFIYVFSSSVEVGNPQGDTYLIIRTRYFLRIMTYYPDGI